MELEQTSCESTILMFGDIKGLIEITVTELRLRTINVVGLVPIHRTTFLATVDLHDSRRHSPKLRTKLLPIPTHRRRSILLFRKSNGQCQIRISSRFEGPRSISTTLSQVPRRTVLELFNLVTHHNVFIVLCEYRFD